MFVGAFFVSAGFGLDADSGVKPFGIVPLGFVCAGAGFGADAVVFGSWEFVLVQYLFQVLSQ